MLGLFSFYLESLIRTLRYANVLLVPRETVLIYSLL